MRPEISMVELLYIHTLRFMSGVTKCFEEGVCSWKSKVLGTLPLENFEIYNVEARKCHKELPA